MPGTSYSEIFDLMLMQVNDHRLTDLYEDSETNFNTYMSGFLKLAIPKFENCTQDLEDRNDSTLTFNITLSTENQVILSLLMSRCWLEKEIQTVMQMNNFIFDKDFKQHSNAQGLRAKQDLFVDKKEEIDNVLTRYGYRNSTDWDSWLSGEFYTA